MCMRANCWALDRRAWRAVACKEIARLMNEPCDRGGFTRQTERSFKTPPKFHEKTPKSVKKERKLWREREKREILGPTLRAPPRVGPHPSGPHVSGFGVLPFGALFSGPSPVLWGCCVLLCVCVAVLCYPQLEKIPNLVWPKLVKVLWPKLMGQTWFGQSW